MAEDSVRLLDAESDLERDPVDEVNDKATSSLIPPSTISVRKSAADFPYSVEDVVSSEGVINIPERKSFHYITRPLRKKHHLCMRWICGLFTLFILCGFVAISIALIVTATALQDSWYRTTVIYNCYLPSFQDSNGDGLGDIEGIKSRVNYFNELGIKAVWINSLFHSPQRNNEQLDTPPCTSTQLCTPHGYEISNYTDIYYKYGTLEDFVKLLDDFHDNGIHVLIDFIPNHTSDQHPWFVESRSSKTNHKRNWYIWANGTMNNEPPNNWISVFGNSSWTYDTTTDEWYFHQFSPNQPDLNYWNPEVKEAMKDVLRFWLDIGVDGFIVNGVEYLLEDPNLTNETSNPFFNVSQCTISGGCYDSLVHNLTRNYIGVHQICQEWHQVVNNYSINSEKILIAEVYSNIETIMSYYGNSTNNEFTFPFNIFLLENKNWTGSNVNCIITKWINNMPEGATANWVLGNDDISRIASRAGIYLARALNVLLLTLPGTPSTYYGEEILMTDVNIPSNMARNMFGSFDAERTPMQWNTTANAGFTTNSTLRLPLAANYAQYNVQVEMNNSTSMLNLYKKILNELHDQKPFYEGTYTCLNATQDILVYARHVVTDTSYTEYYIIAINFSDKLVRTGISLPFRNVELVLTSYLDSIVEFNLGKFDLRSGEAIIVRGYSSDESCQKVNIATNNYCNNNCEQY